MAKYTYPWQRAVMAALRSVPQAADGKSACEALTEDERRGMLRFVASRCGDDENRARKLLEETFGTVKMPAGSGRGSVVLAILLILAALAIGFALSWVMDLLVGAFQELPHVLVWIGLLALWLAGAKDRRLYALWNKHEPTEEGAFKALKRMYYASLRSPFAAIEKWRLILGLLMLIGWTVMLFIPDPPPTTAERLADRIVEVTKGQATLDDALRLLSQVEEGEAVEVMQELCGSTWAGTDDRYLAVALCLRHIDEGTLKLNDYAVGAMGRWVEDVLTNTKAAQIDNPEELAVLPVLLKYASADEAEAMLRRFLALEKVDGAVLTAFGEKIGEGADTAALVAWDAEIAAAGHDPLPFLQNALTGVTLQDAEDCLSGLTDEAQRIRMVKGFAPAITQPDEVLAYIRLAQEYGLSPTECYPDGAVLTWDTTGFDPMSSSWGEPVLAGASFLVVRRTEQKEPYETLPVENEEAEWDVENYDGDAYLGADAQTVVLDIAALERTPAACLPENLADCDVLVIVDMQYYYEGYVRLSRTNYRGDPTGVYASDMQVTTMVDSPLYSAWHGAAAYRMDDRSMLFLFDQMNISSPYVKGEHGLRGDSSSADFHVLNSYIATPSQAWLDSAAWRFMDELEDCKWNFTTMNLKHLWN